MEATRSRNRWVIGLCFTCSFVFAIYPLSMEFRWLRPEFVALLVIYWVMVLPQQIGAGTAWGVGLLQDIIEGSILGGHALALAIVAYICQLTYQRIQNYAIWRQACWVFVLVGIHQLFCNWVNSLSGYTAPPVVFLWPAFMSALIWPLVVVCFDRLRIRFRIS